MARKVPVQLACGHWCRLTPSEAGLSPMGTNLTCPECDTVQEVTVNSTPDVLPATPTPPPIQPPAPERAMTYALIHKVPGHTASVVLVDATVASIGKVMEEHAAMILRDWRVTSEINGGRWQWKGKGTPDRLISIERYKIGTPEEKSVLFIGRVRNGRN